MRMHADFEFERIRWLKRLELHSTAVPLIGFQHLAADAFEKKLTEEWESA